MKLLDGKTAIITGASRGIGKGIALKFAEQGANIAFTYLSSEEKAKGLEVELGAFGITAKGFKSDASDFDSAQQLATAVMETFGNEVPKISSTKSLSGHPLGAASVHEAIYCLIMMKNSFITGSANITEMDEEAKKFPIITKTETEVTLNTVMSNSFGFGGTNAALIFEKV